ncbi:MAG: hypothetical protein AAF329_19965 [Cyanobacteria bacterium P01_A01_bin.17]
MNESAINISRQRLSAMPIQQVSIWQVSVEVAHKGAQLISFIDAGGEPFSWEQIARALVTNVDFRRLWNQTWGELPFDFEWKPVPIHPYTAQTHPFFVIVFPSQFRPADATDFQHYLQGLKKEGLTAYFPNFSGDAHLLIPRETGDYGHIAAFCRTAPDNAQQAIWQRVGEICMEAIAQKESIWCNTHGHGVPWLHIRFDKRLKYASFPPRGSISANSQAIWYQQIYQSAVAASGK